MYDKSNLECNLRFTLVIIQTIDFGLGSRKINAAIPRLLHFSTGLISIVLMLWD